MISKALTKLTPRERMVFELKHYQGRHLRTIAEMLNTTQEAVKNTLFRATQKLRSALSVADSDQHRDKVDWTKNNIVLDFCNKALPIAVSAGLYSTCSK
jgi:hypothetical protein